MTVEQVLASCFSTYMKLSETSVILTLDLHEVFLLTSRLKWLQNVFFMIRKCLCLNLRTSLYFFIMKANAQLF